MSNITLASLAILSSQKELNRHRKQFPCQFERIIEIGSKKDGITFRRYFAMTPAVRYGDFIHNELQSQNDHGRFVYIERLDSSSWYGATFDNDELLYEHIEPFDTLMQTLAYDCHKSASIFSPTDAGDFLVHSEKVVQVDPVDMAWIDEYQLAKIDNYLPVKILGGITGLILGLFVLAYFLMPAQSHSVKANEPINPTTAFLQSYSTQKVSASNALTNAIYLLAETALLPPPMKGDTVTLVKDEKTLQVAVSKNNVRETTWTQWLNAHATLSPLFDSTTSSFVFPLEYKPVLTPLSVTRYQTSLLDALHVLNINVVQASMRRIGSIEVQELQLSMKGSISHLNVLRELIYSPVITATELTLTRANTNEFTLTLSIDIHGITHGN